MINHNLTESTNYNNLEEVGLSILRGYKFTLATLNREMCLQLDVCSRVLQSRSLLEQILDFDGENFILTTKKTDCLAKDNCGIPAEKSKVALSELNKKAASCCAPDSGCC